MLYLGRGPGFYFAAMEVSDPHLIGFSAEILALQSDPAPRDVINDRALKVDAARAA
jgi:hypothetical protein